MKQIHICSIQIAAGTNPCKEWLTTGWTLFRFNWVQSGSSAAAVVSVGRQGCLSLIRGILKDWEQTNPRKRPTMTLQLKTKARLFDLHCSVGLTDWDMDKELKLATTTDQFYHGDCFPFLKKAQTSQQLKRWLSMINGETSKVGNKIHSTFHVRFRNTEWDLEAKSSDFKVQNVHFVSV